MNKENAFSVFEPTINVWQDKELLKNVTVFNFDSLTSNIDALKISYVGMGYYGIVFRIMDTELGVNSTLKLMRFMSPLGSGDLSILLKSSGILQQKNLVNFFLLKDFRGRSENLTKDLALAQSAGHVLGNLIAPNYIDPPVALWVKQGRAIGYSLPYLSGHSIRISRDEDLNTLANILEKDYNLFLGSRGENLIFGSRNAILLSDGQKKFIDVRIKNTEDYSNPSSF